MAWLTEIISLPLEWGITWVFALLSLWSLYSLLCAASPCLPLSSSTLSPSIPSSLAPALYCPRQCCPASFDHRAREEIGSGSESWTGDCRRTRLAYRVGEQRGGRREGWKEEGGERKRTKEEKEGQDTPIVRAHKMTKNNKATGALAKTCYVLFSKMAQPQWLTNQYRFDRCASYLCSDDLACHVCGLPSPAVCMHYPSYWIAHVISI